MSQKQQPPTESGRGRTPCSRQQQQQQIGMPAAGCGSTTGGTAFCQCGCGAPAEAAAAIHAAAAGRRQQQQQQSQQQQSQQQQQQQPGAHHAHAAHFAAMNGGQAMMHPAMFQRPAPYPGQQDMHFQPQFATASAMSQYAAYGGALPAELHVAAADPYRGAHHHHQLPYRASVELPRGGYLVPTSPHGVPASAYLAAPGPGGLSYYRQFPPGMVQMAAGAIPGDREPSAGAKLAAAISFGGGGSGGGAGGTPPEKAPPPSPSAAASSGYPAGGGLTAASGEGGGKQPKESILESLLAARSERLSAGSMEAEELTPGEAAGIKSNGGGAAVSVSAAAAAADRKSACSPTSPLRTNPQDTGAHATVAGSGKAGAGAASGVEAGDNSLAEEQQRQAAEACHSVAAVAASPSNSSPAAAAAAAASANVSAAVAMHLTGLPGGFSGVGSMHHGIGTMQGVGGMGGMRGMPPPTAVAVSPAGGPAAMQPYMASQQQQPSPAGFASHDAFEEHVRQQEKKLQKRAANRKSAQLSRKRKKALIEELRYENQDLQRHEDILEVIPDPVFAFDTANGRVWFASTSASAQFGQSVEDLTSACFFDLMTEDCSKRLRVLIDTAAKDVSETNSSLLHERMTVRFKKRKGAILLGELSGRLSHLNGVTTAVCSVRPLSLATDEIVGKGYIGDASVGELAEDTSADQGSSGEDSRSAGTGQTTTGSSGDCTSSGLGTGFTSIADEASSSGGGVPSLSSLEVKRRDGGAATSSSGDGGGGPGNASNSTGSGGGSVGSAGGS
ncbi:unnamed protein product, partial [Ectocarpus fasciculatus]